jgi:hypothetical protein
MKILGDQKNIEFENGKYLPLAKKKNQAIGT